MNTSELLTFFVEKLLDDFAEALTELTDDQLYHLPGANACPIAFHAWHVVRTADNVINFVCQDRKPPVWLRQELPEKWRLPKVAQGTGMELAEAQALRFPSLGAFLQYARDVQEDIRPYLASAGEADLQTIIKVAPFGERPKVQQIVQTLLTHGHLHLGQVMLTRSLLGLPASTT